jgi:hypothetical protein
MLRKRVRLTRSLFLEGDHAEKGSIHDLSKPLADDLIRQGSALPLNFFPRFFARIRFFIDSQIKRKERT